jgi:nitrate reductase NapE component
MLLLRLALMLSVVGACGWVLWIIAAHFIFGQPGQAHP